VTANQKDFIRALIERCIGHMKPTVRQKGLECFNKAFEVSAEFEDVVPTILEALQSKNLKVRFESLFNIIDSN